MKKNIYSLFTLIAFVFSSNQSFAQAKIKIYFTNAVDTTVAKMGVNAVYLSEGAAADTIAAYINRAVSTVDIAQYDFTYNGTTLPIISALSNACDRGVKIRYVYDQSELDGGADGAIAALPSCVSKTARPDDYYGDIMHDKYIIIDAASSNPVPIVCTGSDDWSEPMLDGGDDYNNILFIQDSALAAAYEEDFNQMFAGTFGPDKTSVSTHTFSIGGNTVELYFSPVDGVNTHIQNTIATANTDVYVGMYTFTESSDAFYLQLIHSGAYVNVVLDYNSASMYSTLVSYLGAANVTEFNPTGSSFDIYHNKYLIVDPNNPCSDPQVLTGSHNWTSTANSENDENIVIIHNDTVANIFYQSFYKDFTVISGTSPEHVDIPGSCKYDSISKVPETALVENTATVFPNPTNGEVDINYSLSSAVNSNVEIYNIVGQKIVSLVNKDLQQPGNYNYSYTFKQPGMYFIQFTIGQERFTRKVIVTE